MARAARKPKEEFRDQILEWKSKRGNINAEIKAVMEKAESMGIPKKSLRNAISYYEASPEQRDGYHQGYALCLEAFGMPVTAFQSEMIGEALTEGDDGQEGF